MGSAYQIILERSPIQGGLPTPPPTRKAGDTHPTGMLSCLDLDSTPFYFHTLLILPYVFILADYSLFDTPPVTNFGSFTLSVKQRSAFTYGVKSCADARILLVALHVRSVFHQFFII